MVAIPVPDNYGLVIGVALGAIPLLGFVHGGVTTSIRKEAKVPYPHSYASVEQCQENVSPSPSLQFITLSLDINLLFLSLFQAKAEQFNCAQRAHSNFLENSSQTMLCTLVAGLKYPELAAGIGSVWVLSRVMFLYGYVYSGQAQGKGRFNKGGPVFWLAQGALWGLAVFGVGKDLVSL
ncbi:glutathione S-transferase [Penicillium alfredii]|uniref:Glutathione S-transferase n=1 Tax=Penicillium alfredii TaxID=1506179 RepID=A0A9W9EM26_9EURO|nr:glutathione S-transferase [Penicillium alfredii]KAJ5084199.1 glutathione S-transferase [Penicillium alfredii]